MLKRNPRTNLCMIDVECYKARERNVSLSTSIQGREHCAERNGSIYDIDTENDDDDFNSAMETNGSTDTSGNGYDTDTDNVENNAPSTIYTFSTTVSNEVISTLARTGFPSTPWPSLALRARFARFREMQEVETLIIDSSAAFMRMNTILYADDVIVTSTDVTMRREEFEQWQTEMTQSNGNNFPRINDSDIISRSTSGNWILDSGASTHVVNIRAHRRVVQNAVAGIVSDRYIYYNGLLDVQVPDLDEDDEEDAFWDLPDLLDDDEEDAFWDLPDLLDDDDITLPMPKLKLTSEQSGDFNYLDFKATRGFDLDARFKWDDDDDDDDCSSVSVRIVEVRTLDPIDIYWSSYNMQWNFTIPEEEKKNIAELICKILKVATSVVDELDELGFKTSHWIHPIFTTTAYGRLEKLPKTRVVAEARTPFLERVLTNGFVYMK